VIWADRVGVVWSVLAGTVLVLTAAAASDVGWMVFTHPALDLALIAAIATPWLLLRGIWWAATGGTGRSRL